MKIEGSCTTVDCLAFGYRQLFDAARLARKLAIDNDGNDVTCPFCGGVVEVLSATTSDAVFPVGHITATDAAKRVLSFNRPDDPLTWMEVAEPLLKRHQRGDHGSVTQEALAMNRAQQAFARVQDPIDRGIIVSMYVVNRDPLWFVTNNTRTQTLICLPEEYGALQETGSAGL